jgi:hypothetical protein
MKSGLLKIIIAVLVGVSLAVATPALARNGSHHYGYYQNHHNNHYRGHHSSHHVIGGIIGGVILGSIVHQSTRPHYNRAVYAPRHRNQTVIIDSSPVATFRTLNDKECYLVNINQHGNEILTQVPNINCGF